MENYYCSQKFYQLKIDAEKRILNSCCKADQEIIDTDWLEKNKGQLFNTPKLLQERQQMLNNVRIKGCENACWKNEDRGLWSRRLRDRTDKRTITSIKNTPKHLDITLSSDCNLACSYCCKSYSSTWRKETIRHGNLKNLNDYSDRYIINNFDLAIDRLSQKDKKKLKIYSLLEQEIEHMKQDLTSVTVTGGEPFLHHSFPKVIHTLKDVKYLTVYTGLGVSEAVLRRGLEVLAKNKNVEICVSAESVEDNFEFNRYGSNWKTFVKHLDTIKSYGIKVTFNMSYGNLNVVDFVEFNDLFGDYDRKLNMVHEPAFLAVYNMDDETKDNLIKSIETSRFSNTRDVSQLVNTLSHNTNEVLRKHLSIFLKQICKRRSNTIDFMPDSFKDWINFH